MHHAGTKLEMLPYKFVKNNKRVVCLAHIQYYLLTSLLWSVYYDNWRYHLKNNKKNCAFDLLILFTCIIFSACQFLRYFFKNYAGCHINLQISDIYIYIFKIRNRETYHLKWVFLPQWMNHEWGNEDAKYTSMLTQTVKI